MLDRDGPHWIVRDDAQFHRVATLVDLGGSVVPQIEDDLTPARAHELGRALILWSSAKRAARRQAIRDAKGLGPEVIVHDDGTHITPGETQ